MSFQIEKHTENVEVLELGKHEWFADHLFSYDDLEFIENFHIFMQSQTDAH